MGSDFEPGNDRNRDVRMHREENSQGKDSKRKNQTLAKEIEDLLRRVDALPTIDSRPEDEILGYDDDGSPR